MKAFRIAIAIIAVAMFITLSASNAKADEWDKKTIVTFDQPVEIPGMVLAAGTYVFRRASSTDPNVVRIFGKDETHVYATLLAIPDYRMNPADKTLITFEERATGSPRAIKSWFYPGDTAGEEFVYTSPGKTINEIGALQTQIAELRDARPNVLMQSTSEPRQDLPRRIRPPWPLRLPTRWRLPPIERPPMPTAALKQPSSTLRPL